jgi:hypothetical protein
MTRKGFGIAAAALLLGLGAAAVGAEQAAPDDAGEAKSRVLVDALQFNRRAMVAVNLRLGEEEARRFWPLYERYQQELTPLGDRLKAIVEEYVARFDQIADEEALRAMEEYLAIETRRLEVRRAYLGEFAKIVPGRTVARFYQLENKMDAVIRYQLAETIPVVADEAGAAPR